jgi:predicted nucleic acid-binding Zn ribbon protein
MAAYEETQQFCSTCNRNVLARRRSTNHILHFLITVFTCGAWIFIWPLLSIRVGGWRCTNCGSAKMRRPA